MSTTRELDNAVEMEPSPMLPIKLPDNKEYHAFISYASSDLQAAIEIDRLLQSLGFKCCLHDRDFIPGRDIADNFYSCIAVSFKFIFLLSEWSIESPWCQYELAFTRIQSIEHKGFKPIVLKLDDCNLPDSLSRYTYLALSNEPKDWLPTLVKAINDKNDHLITSRREIKFVPLPCIKYNRDKEHHIPSCRYPHICTKHIVSDEPCDGNCDKNHNLITEQSREILVDLGFITDGNLETLEATYKQMCKEKLLEWPKREVLGPCCYYNYQGCLFGESHCPFTHICKNWFNGKCLENSCKLSHDILNHQSRRVLELFNVDLQQSKDNILTDYRDKYPQKQFVTLPTKQREVWFYVRFIVTVLLSCMFIMVFNQILS